MVYYVETNSVSMLDFALDKVGREDGWNNLIYVGLISSYQVDRMAGIRFMSIRHYVSRERAIEVNGPIEEYGAIFITEGNGEFPKVVKCQRTIKGPVHEITVSLEYDEKKLSKGTISIDNDSSWKNRYFKDIDEFRKELNFFEEVKSVSLCRPNDIRKLMQFIDGDSSCFNEDWDVFRFIISRRLQAHSN